MFVENTISYLSKVMRAKFLGSNRLFCFNSIFKFGSFKNPFATISSLSELYFWIRRLILFMQTKKMISVNYGSSTSTWKPWRSVRPNLIISMRDIHINSNLNPLKKSTSSRRSTKLKDTLSWNISYDHEDHPNHHDNSHKLYNETGCSIVNLMESQWKLRQQHDQNFPVEGKPL